MQFSCTGGPRALDLTLAPSVNVFKLPDMTEIRCFSRFWQTYFFLPLNYNVVCICFLWRSTVGCTPWYCGFTVFAQVSSMYLPCCEVLFWLCLPEAPCPNDVVQRYTKKVPDWSTDQLTNLATLVQAFQGCWYWCSFLLQAALVSFQTAFWVSEFAIRFLSSCNTQQFLRFLKSDLTSNVRKGGPRHRELNVNTEKERPLLLEQAATDALHIWTQAFFLRQMPTWTLKIRQARTTHLEMYAAPERARVFSDSIHLGGLLEVRGCKWLQTKHGCSLCVLFSNILRSSL